MNNFLPYYSTYKWCTLHKPIFLPLLVIYFTLIIKQFIIILILILSFNIKIIFFAFVIMLLFLMFHLQFKDQMAHFLKLLFLFLF